MQPASPDLARMRPSLAGAERDTALDTRLGLVLCFIAGAVNAGGFLLVGLYTSHMSGAVSAVADHLAIGEVQLALGSLAVVGCFVAGAATSAILINWGRRHRAEAQYALPLLLEAALLMLFGFIGQRLQGLPHFALIAIPTLGFIMGLQNAIITKISQARMRTTHVTGILTDIGIELGKLVYRNRPGMADVPVFADREKLKLLGQLVSAFLIGGVAGAVAFKTIGALATLPLAALLVASAVRPLTHRRTAPLP